jgi:ribosomal protein S18 acetylase RimI-like enzyme
MKPADIRPLGLSIYEQAIALWRSTPGVGLSEADGREAVERFLARNPGLSFVAVDAGHVIGTVLCGHDGRRGLIHHLLVAPAARRRGLATRLLRAALEALRAQGVDKCHLLVFRDNAEGLAFWRAAKAIERTELAVFSVSTRQAVR